MHDSINIMLYINAIHDSINIMLYMIALIFEENTKPLLSLIPDVLYYDVFYYDIGGYSSIRRNLIKSNWNRIVFTMHRLI